MKKLKSVLVRVITLAAITAPVAGYAQAATVNITEPSNVMYQVAGSSDAVNLTWWTPYSTNSAYVEYSSSPDPSEYGLPCDTRFGCNFQYHPLRRMTCSKRTLWCKTPILTQFYVSVG